ncbi:ethionine resistance protein [Entomophthora muscae]|uniref:Ethionine resistance protein n=1 Tax=Entomophthora muscae TaxID=34485 RepID=A0ACC2UJZ4_9FUNG|nr:ethionine resistance protein [Entomophthora muscae]
MSSYCSGKDTLIGAASDDACSDVTGTESPATSPKLKPPLSELQLIQEIEEGEESPDETTDIEALALIPSPGPSKYKGVEDISKRSYLSGIAYLVRYSYPVVASYLLQASIPATSNYFLSHLGSSELDAAALGNTFASVTGWSLCLGMATSLDTLCSQTFTGGGSITRVGTQLQRGLLVSFAMLVPILILWWNIEVIMKHFIDASLVENSSLYLRVLILGAPAYSGFECVKKFLQAQGIMSASTCILLLASPINLVFNYLLVSNPKTSLGFVGAPLAQVLTLWLMFIFSILYVCFINGKQAWGGWSRDCLRGWSTVIKLGLPGMGMICADWWAFEIILVAASRLGKTPLTAHTIMGTLSMINYMAFHGLGIATSCLIGNYLGQGNCKAARKIARCSVLLSILMSIVTSAFLFTFRHSVANFATSDAPVAKVLISFLPLVCMNQLIDGLATTDAGILRGQGRQRIGAVVYIIGFYLLGIPLGLFLTFYANMGLLGLWIGISTSLLFIGLSLTFFIFITNWQQQVLACRERLNRTK